MSKNKPVNVRKRYEDLQERFNEMYVYLSDFADEHKRNEEELKYLYSFLVYKKIEKEFYYFREHAHEEQDPDTPFPRLVL